MYLQGGTFGKLVKIIFTVQDTVWGILEEFTRGLLASAGSARPSFKQG
jgi:hypothetical protein